ncbi:Spermine/spermidine acetyltransferase, partial [Dysosmobacter welbionis]
GVGPGVPAALLGRGAGDLLGDVAVQPIPVLLAEGLLHQPVLAGVEGEDGRPPAGLQHMGELFQKGVQHLELTVHVDPQRLEGPLTGLLHRLLPLPGGEERQRPLNEGVQLAGGIHSAAPAEHLNDGLCDAVRVGLVGIFHQQVLQLLLVQLPQPL